MYLNVQNDLAKMRNPDKQFPTMQLLKASVIEFLDLLVEETQH